MVSLPFQNALAIGEAPSACTPTILGTFSVIPNSLSSLNPFQIALMFPAFPTGRTT